MDKNKAKNQKYISRFCSLLDELLAAYQNEPDNSSRHHKFVAKALFLAHKLGLVSKGHQEFDWNGERALFGPEGWYWIVLSKDVHDQKYIQEQFEKRAQREERIRRFQEKARSLLDKDFSLDITSRVDRTNLAEDVQKFNSCIDEIIEIYEIPHDNPEIHRFGRRANRLAVKIGLTCQDRELAQMCRINRSEDKIPYVESDWWGLSRMMNKEPDKRVVARWRTWQRRAVVLLKTSEADSIPNSYVLLEHRESIVTQDKEYDFFICHASEDKNDFVRSLANNLQKLGGKVWYDEFSLTVGDSLRRKIDEGLTKSRFGVVVLSNSFFKKEWPQKELDALVSRETEGHKVILPIWHGVTQEEVKHYSAILSDKYALDSTFMTIEVLAKKLVEQL